MPGTLLPVGHTEARGAAATLNAQKPGQLSLRSPRGVLNGTGALGEGREDKGFGCQFGELLVHSRACPPLLAEAEEFPGRLKFVVLPCQG